MQIRSNKFFLSRNLIQIDKLQGDGVGGGICAYTKRGEQSVTRLTVFTHQKCLYCFFLYNPFFYRAHFLYG